MVLQAAGDKIIRFPPSYGSPIHALPISQFLSHLHHHPSCLSANAEGAEAVEAVEAVEAAEAVAAGGLVSAYFREPSLVTSCVSCASGNQLTSVIGHNRPGGPAVQPSTAVAKIEDETQSKKLGQQLTKLNLAPSFPQRPGHGTMGRPVTVWANYVEMITSSDMTLYRYDMSVSPAAAGRKLKQIIRQLLDAPELAGVRHDIVSDFKSTLISRTKLDKNETLVNVLYQNENHDEPRDDAPTYTVRVLYTNTLSVRDLVNHLKSADPSTTFLDKQPTIQALNIFLNHHAKTNPSLTTIGSSRTFSLSPGTDFSSLGAGLVAIRGFFASVRVVTSRILVNVNVSHGVIYQHGPLDGLIKEYMQPSRGMPALSSFVRRLRVTMAHIKKKKNRKGEEIARVKTILGLATQNDGHGMEHPPRVENFGAGPKGVLFWMDPAVGTGGSSGGTGGGKKKGKGQGGKPPPSTGAGKYISVYDYFKQSKPPIPTDPPTKSSTYKRSHSTQARDQSQPPRRQRRHAREADVPPRRSLRRAPRPKRQYKAESRADPENDHVCGSQAVGKCRVDRAQWLGHCGAVEQHQPSVGK